MHMNVSPAKNHPTDRCVDPAQRPNPAPFFIVGAGRSGSTLLRMMLISHSRICIPPETWYLAPLLKRFGTQSPLSRSELESAISIMTSHYRWPDMRLGLEELRQRIAGITQPRLRDLVECVYSWHMEQEGKSRWGDKTPTYVTIVPQLAKLFPEARFIHLLRDGRDVAASFQRQGWKGPWLYANTGKWIEAVQCEQSWRGSPLEERLLRVRYEDVVLDTEATLRGICDFIGEEFEPRMLSWDDGVDESVPSRERHIHQKLKSQPSGEDVYRWKQEMSPRQVWIAESFMRGQLKRTGYELKYRGAGWVPALLATRVLCRLVLPVVSFQRRALGYLGRRVQKLGTKP